MTDILYIDQLDLKGKKVFLRTDFNVPLDEHGNIRDDMRIREALPGIHHCLDMGAAVIIASHLGRPKGKSNRAMGLAPVARRLSRLLGREVPLAPNCIGPDTARMAGKMTAGDLILLENLRFHDGEEKNDPGFAEALRNGSTVYINDAFASCHRAHASIVALPRLYSEKGGGFLLKKELSYFHRALEDPQRPLAAVIGGAKISDKLPALENLLSRVNKLLIGGGMAFTFLAAQGLGVGKSILEPTMLDTATRVIRMAHEKGVSLYLPTDCVAAGEFSQSARTRIVPVQEIPEGWYGMDIGPATMLLFSEALTDAKTIVWNGPMGVIEFENFTRGTSAIISAMARSYALTIVGGGDTHVAVLSAGEAANISYVSTGGGAFLELLKGRPLPGLTALTNQS